MALDSDTVLLPRLPERFSAFRVWRAIRFGLARTKDRSARIGRKRRRLRDISRQFIELGFHDCVVQALLEFDEQTEVPDLRAGALLHLAQMALIEGDGTDHERAVDTVYRAAQISDISMEVKHRASLLSYALRLQMNEAFTLDEDFAFPDLFLLCMSGCGSIERRLMLLNSALAAQGLGQMQLDSDKSGGVLSRLLPATTPQTPPQSALRITLIVPLCSFESSLVASLKSIDSQRLPPVEVLLLNATGQVVPEIVRQKRDGAEWREIILPPGTSFFAAANKGLALAKGEAIAIFRPGDMALPHWLERAAESLDAVPARLAVMPNRASLTEDIRTGLPDFHGAMAPADEVSALFRTRPLREQFGGWVDLRLCAEADLITRIRKTCGASIVHPLEGGPDILSNSANPPWPERILPEPALRSALLHQMQSAAPGGLHATPAEKLPRLLRPNLLNASDTVQYDVILASDFRLRGGNNMSNAQELACHRLHGIRTGVLPMYRHDFHDIDRPLQPEIRAEIDGEMVELLCSGMRVSCDLLIIRYPSVLWKMQRFLPQVTARNIRVIVNQPPMSDYGPTGTRRYDIADCAQVLRNTFGKDALWHPIGPLVRQALREHHAEELTHITLSEDDWYNVIDLDGWEAPRRDQSKNRKLRIGRHSRDSAHKWPATAAEILSAYPESEDIEVHVLGGTKVPEQIMGYRPKNWKVHEYGTLHPRDFLRSIDVWVYFANPDWVESFGRTIIEAMAVGIPVILPELYRPLFREAALYATEDTAVALAKGLYANQEAYAAQSACAKAYVKERFSYEAHLQRLAAARQG